MSNDDRQVIFSLVGVGKVHPPGREVLKDIYLSFFYGAKIGILGLNGAGKSTLLRIIAGVERDHLGETAFSGGYSVGLLEQEPRMEPDRTVREVVEEGCSRMLALLAEYESVSARFGEEPDAGEMEALLERQAKLQDAIEAGRGWELESRLEVAMDALRCPPSEVRVDRLSGGERRRVALCRLLIQEPDILLLDEPTNHLDAESVRWLEQHMARYRGTVIAVTHDRCFLDNVAGWILELDRGRGIPFEGNYSSWLEQKQARLAQEEKSLSRRRKTLERELEWVRMSPRARQAKGKARLARYGQLLEREQASAQEDLEIYIPPGPRLGDIVLQAQGLAHGFGGRLLFEDLSFTMPPGAIVGVIGPNGSGKTTLLRIITGAVECQAGSFRVGDTVRMGYVDQSRTLNDEHTVWEAISDGADRILLGKREINSRAYVGRFNFSGQDQQKKVRDLSGGERNRVHLARMLKEEANLLLLDEPTNDLDVNTMRALEDGILEFGGSCVVVSHDRWFLERIATHILAFEGDSRVVWFEGNYSDYEEDRRRRLGKDADQPHRLRYRRLTRD